MILSPERGDTDPDFPWNLVSCFRLVVLVTKTSAGGEVSYHYWYCPAPAELNSQGGYLTSGFTGGYCCPSHSEKAPVDGCSFGAFLCQRLMLWGEAINFNIIYSEIRQFQSGILLK